MTKGTKGPSSPSKELEFSKKDGGRRCMMSGEYELVSGSQTEQEKSWCVTKGLCRHTKVFELHLR